MSMGGNLSGFDANTVEPASFDVLPAGEYTVAIMGSSMKPTKNGDGRYLELEMQVLNGEFQNRKLFDRLNLMNPNQKAVDIAKGQLSAICRAVGILTPNDSSDLHNKPLVVKVKVRKDEEHGEQNEVKAYKPRLAGPAAPQGGIPGAAPLAPGPGGPMSAQAAAGPWPGAAATQQQAAQRF